MRRLLPALILAASLATPASAAPKTHHLVLRGARSASVDVTFATRFRPLLGVIDSPADVSVTTKGTFAGVFFENLSRKLGVGAVQVPEAAGLGQAWPMSWGASDERDFSLPAGRYRVHLLADGQATVRVGVEGLARDVSYVPRGRSQVTGRLVEVPDVHVDIPVNVRSTTTTVLVAYTDQDVSLPGATSICLDEDADGPCEAGTTSWGVKSAHAGVGLRSSGATGLVLYPGFLGNGEHVASFTMAEAGVHRGGPWAFALSVN